MVHEYRPEWSDPNEPATIVKKGSLVENMHNNESEEKIRFQKKKRKNPSVEELMNGVLDGNRSILARAITLIESNAEHHFQSSQQLLQKLLPYSGNSIRIGITGVPGVGKSTFIETFGSYLCDRGLKVAVLAIDPTSTISGGSILGDKTRMEKLSRHENAFIRPSPSGGKLGGVHRKTQESIIICEAARFDVILVETVGVGQSEVAIRDMVDFFMLLVLTGAGDELQGMKKGIMELADLIVVNKADGNNLQDALKTKEEYNRVLPFLQPATKGWQTKAVTCSSVFGEGIDKIWEMVQKFEKAGKQTGVFDERRKEQKLKWMNRMIIDQLQADFFSNAVIKQLLPKLERDVVTEKKTVASAVELLLLNHYREKGI